MNPMYQQPAQPYGQHLAMLEQMRNQYQGQTIQPIKSFQPQVQCYYVNSAEEMGQIQAQMNTVYIGLNSAKDEVYIRQWTNDGLIELKTYTKSGGKQEPSELKVILAELQNIKQQLNGGNHESNDVHDGRESNERNVPTTYATGNVGGVTAVTGHGNVQ